MRVLTFHLNGKMAHFRKYYSNSTALSYMLPPLTTVKGILAGVLGYERDSYYGDFSAENCKIGIVVEKPIKKMTQTMNLLKVESLNDLSGAGLNRTQNDMEFIIPRNIRLDEISYRIYCHHKNPDILDALEALLCEEHFYRSRGINVCLGSMQCQGRISGGEMMTLRERIAGESEVSIFGSLPKESIAMIDPRSNTELDILKEETIIEFGGGRILTENSKKDILANMRSGPLKLRLKPGTVYYEAGERNIFLL